MQDHQITDERFLADTAAETQRIEAKIGRKLRANEREGLMEQFVDQATRFDSIQGEVALHVHNTTSEPIKAGSEMSDRDWLDHQVARMEELQAERTPPRDDLDFYKDDAEWMTRKIQGETFEFEEVDE